MTASTPSSGAPELPLRRGKARSTHYPRRASMTRKSIRSVLVANRGEIARRIFRTCREMGIETIAVFSDPDREAPFVREADRGVAIGGASPADSYLRIDSIIAAAKSTSASAIHPGYGFLAENAAFAEAVLEAGLLWVGPSPEAIRIMGSKLESKALVEKVGVPTLRSVDLTGLDEGSVAKAAREIGFPVLVKASAGGGGKGMRIVACEEELGDAVEAARREALSAFGDSTVFLERYLQSPRHIEIQVFGDSHGNIVSLFERECSIQRRHQKIIEESPSPAVDEELRRRMGDAAIAVAEAVDYVGAGTVEFLVQEGDFYFLEMNTRLQVEHPVTEEITGFDLVRLQLRVAAGETLDISEPETFGHAIEARLYAEDPRNDFLPVTGRLDRFRFPEMAGLRLDSGVEDGSVVSVHYDPLLAKVVAWAETREEAASLLAYAIQRAEVHGSITNRDLLARILGHPEFLAGNTDTHFLIRHDPSDLAQPLPDIAEEKLAAVVAALVSQADNRENASTLRTIPSGWRNNPSDYQVLEFSGEYGTHRVGYRFDARNGLLVQMGNDELENVGFTRGDDRHGLEFGGHLRWYRVNRVGMVHHIDGPAGYTRLIEKPRFPMAAIEDDPGSLHAPMPGRVLDLKVSEGDRVEESQVLLVMEAMKMEHTLRAPFGGKVLTTMVSEGDQVDADQVLIVVEEG